MDQARLVSAALRKTRFDENGLTERVGRDRTTFQQIQKAVEAHARSLKGFRILSINDARTIPIAQRLLEGLSHRGTLLNEHARLASVTLRNAQRELEACQRRANHLEMIMQAEKVRGQRIIEEDAHQDLVESAIAGRYGGFSLNMSMAGPVELQKTPIATAPPAEPTPSVAAHDVSLEATLEHPLLGRFQVAARADALKAIALNLVTPLEHAEPIRAAHNGLIDSLRRQHANVKHLRIEGRDGSR